MSGILESLAHPTGRVPASNIKGLDTSTPC
jgi:hypothetical protein